MRIGSIGVWVRYKDLDRLSDEEFAQFWSLMFKAQGSRAQHSTPPLRSDREPT